MNPKQAAVSLLSKTEIGREIVRSQHYQMVLSASMSFVLNVFYALYHGALGLINLSLWFMAMCAFYGILATMRFAAVLCGRRNTRVSSIDTAYFVMTLSGILLCLLSIVLAAVIVISLSQNVAAKHGEIVMITIATYTFYKITMAVIKAVKQHRNPSPLLTVIRRIRYAEIAASILTLQRSMLVSFGSMGKEQMQGMNAITGAAVCLFVLILGISMTIKGTRKGNESMAKSKFVKANEKIAEKVVGTFEKMEDTVVSGYRKIEDAFVDRYLTKDGETVEEAKKRLKRENESGQ